MESFVIQTAKLQILEKEKEWSEEVYDLTIEDNHEYFANGILVHNCDALRYCIHTWKAPQISFMKPKITNFGSRNNY
jgi:hypothetical protein